jgi:formylmethanofuran dehydrogenase subunit E
MLLPLDLAALAWRHSHLTPELALGWRLGRHAHEWFDGLDRVRIAATGHAHTLTALRRLARFPEPGAVVHPTGPRPWDMLFLHEPTGTALKVVCVNRRTTLPLAIRELGDQLDCGDSEITRRYQDGLTALVGEIVTGDLAGFCLVSEIRYRTLAVEKIKLPARCPWCLATGLSHLVEVDGRIRCPACSGLEPAWLVG